MARALELLFIVLLVVAGLVALYMFTGRRLERRRNDPFRGMTRKDRSAVLRQQHELDQRQRKIEIQQQELELQERQTRFFSRPLPGMTVTGTTTDDTGTTDPEKKELP